MSATYCPVGNTVSATLLPCGQYAPLLNRHLLPCGQYGVGYAIALCARCCRGLRAYAALIWAESIAQKRLFFERYFAISQANLIVYCPKRWLVRSGGFFFVESS